VNTKQIREDDPEVSVIMPAHNAAATIAESMESILRQTYKNWELIIVDDGSTDNTFGVVRKYLDDPRIKLIRCEKNAGMSTARNLGVAKASGEFIAFLDSDDLWMPTKLQKQIEYHKKNPNCRISHTDFREFYPSGKEKRPWRQFFASKHQKNGVLLPHLYYDNLVATLTVMMRRDIFINLGGFDTELFGVEDQDLWLKIAKLGYEFGYMSEVLSKYRMSPTGASKDITRYKESVREFLVGRVINDPKVPPAVKRKAWANYYLAFGRLYHRRGEHVLAHKYYCASLRFHHVSVPHLAVALIFLFSNYAAVLAGKMTKLPLVL
jgi:glycosyltransferase involved in cell wall biosynthesis